METTPLATLQLLSGWHDETFAESDQTNKRQSKRLFRKESEGFLVGV